MSPAAGGVLVFSERPGATAELLGLARRLVDLEGHGIEVVAARLGGAAETAEDEDLLPRGADRVVVCGTEDPQSLDAQPVAKALAEIVRRIEPRVVLIGATKQGTELAARLAQRLGVACANECASVVLAGDEVIVERSLYARFVARQRIETRPALATIPLGRFEPLMPRPVEQRKPQVLAVAAGAPRVRVLGSRARPQSRCDMGRARAIVSVGRGLRRAEDLPLVERLAAALGAAIGASRPLTDHLQWLPADVKVGLSGQTVRPDLYVACGISGQIEHVVGMRESRIVVAINTDPAAPILKEADYYVVGDLYAILPAVVRAIEEQTTGKEPPAAG